MDEVRSGEHLACSGHDMSPVAKGELETDTADDPGGLCDLAEARQHQPEVKGRPRTYSVHGPSLCTQR